MAKKPKETNVPLIFALVFFVLTTIAFGVMWYLSYSDQQTKDDAVKKANTELKTARDEAREAQTAARVYKVYLGIASEDDKNFIATEAKPNDKMTDELKKIHDEVVNKVGDKNVGLDSLPDELKFWRIDSTGKVTTPLPTEGLIDQIAKIKGKEVAYDAAGKERDNYRLQISKIDGDIKALQKAKADFEKVAKDLPAEIKKDVSTVITNLDAQIEKFIKAEDAANAKISTLTLEVGTQGRKIGKLEEQIKNLQADNLLLNTKITRPDAEQFTYDEPQGKILRKLPEGVVEINIGSAVGVRPGLTFTVLPPDFPSKGRQSRMRVLRIPDSSGQYKPVEMFVPKGSIEVFEVVSANLSLARIMPGSELDPIRDGVTSSDLLYNSVWRKGVADHIALIGIFDINGDGTDDIATVVRDLTKMGIPVDAYFDMTKRQWVGTVTERTRNIIEGYYPLNSITDPNQAEKTKLLAAMTDAVNQGKNKGVGTVNFRDFFSRMGYKFRLDVTDDKINQATAPYLSNVGVGDPLVPKDN